MGGECGTYEGQESCMQGLLWRPVRNRPIVTRKLRWEDNNKKDIEEMGWRTWNLLISPQDKESQPGLLNGEI